MIPTEKFISFLESLETGENKSFIETVRQGFSVCHESSDKEMKVQAELKYLAAALKKLGHNYSYVAEGLIEMGYTREEIIKKMKDMIKKGKPGTWEDDPDFTPRK